MRRTVLIVMSATVLAAAGEGTAQEAASSRIRPCTVIPSLPYSIDQPGEYCLTATLTTDITSGAAITVDADDVTLRLGNFVIDGTAGGPDTGAVGIFSVNHRRLRIQGGWVFGFAHGLLITDNAGVSEGHVVDGLRAVGSRAVGISVAGARSIVRRCLVSSVRSGGPFAVGIAQTGSASAILENQVFDVRASRAGGYAAGIAIPRPAGRLVAGNQVQTVLGSSGNYGIRCGAPFRNLNRVEGTEVAFSTCDRAGRSITPYPYPYPPNPSPSPSPYPYPTPYPNPSPYPRRSHAPSDAGLGVAAVAGLAVVLSVARKLAA